MRNLDKFRHHETFDTMTPEEREEFGEIVLEAIEELIRRGPLTAGRIEAIESDED